MATAPRVEVPGEEKRPPREWEQRFGRRVVDPDGWRNAIPHAFLEAQSYDEPITYAEFVTRAGPSTTAPLDYDQPKVKAAPARPEQGVKEDPRAPLYRIRVGQRAVERLVGELAAATRYVTDRERMVELKRQELIAEEQRLHDAQLDAAAAQEALDLFYLGREAERREEQGT